MRLKFLKSFYNPTSVQINQRDSNSEKQDTRVRNYLTQLEKANFKVSDFNKSK